MSGTSVTGVGNGDAGINRGPGNNRSQYCPLVDPHIVWQGQASLVGGVATVSFPSSIVAPAENLSVIISGKALAVSKIVDATGNMTGFTAIGYYVTSFDYVVIRSNSASFCSDYA